MMPEPLVTELDLIKARVTSLERELARLTALITPVPMTPTADKGTQGTMTVAQPDLLTKPIIGYVMSKGEFANVRHGASTVASPIVYTIKTGDIQAVIDTVSDWQGLPFKWYQLTEGNYVREDVVTFSTEKPSPAPVSDKWPAPVSVYSAISNTHHNERNHDGLDFVAPKGMPVHCGPFGGVVVKDFTCYSCKSDGDGPASLNDKSKAYGYGSYVIVGYRYGQMPKSVQDMIPANAWVYAMHSHLSRVDVRQGETLVANQKIGEVGATGNVYGEKPWHLHYALRWSINANADWYALESNQINPALLVIA